ncbi:MAG TPA: ATP synthase F0 subunit B [Clostridia bacterium]|nr:ATP synthase F0 subunit B [Clostridia bacterium]
MNTILLAASKLPLGLNFFEVLLHMLNLAILIVGVRFLLYKPIKKFMDKRSEEYLKAEEEAEAKLKEAEELKARYEKIAEESRLSAITASQEAAASALIQADEIIDNAKAEAARIIKAAEEEAKHKEILHKKELSNSVSELAVELASKLIKKEYKPEDNDPIIKDLVERWKG